MTPADLNRIDTKLDMILVEAHALNARITVLERVDAELGMPKRREVSDLTLTVERLKSQQPKSAAAGIAGGGMGLVALVIEGLRLWLGGGTT